MNGQRLYSSIHYQHRDSGNPLHIWGGIEPDVHFAGHGGAEFAGMMQEVDRQMDEGLPLGLALVVGELDPAAWRLIRKVAQRQADYVAWVVAGPVLIGVFRQGLYEALRMTWRKAVAGNGDVSAAVVFSVGLRDHAELMLAARIALHRAMAQNTDLVVLAPGEALQAVADHRIATTMKRHLAGGGGDFAACFQPQVELKTGRPIGAEALARWRPDDEDIPPARFIPIAEEAGLVGDIGQMMLGLSARTLKVLRGSGIEIARIAVNVSPAQSRQGDFLRTILDVLHAEKLSASDIELEITESLVGSGGDEFLRWLAELSAAGFEIAIDDFGTGTSTLARVRDIPARTIKLDRAFVTPLPHDEGARTVCRTALDMVRGLGKTSLAEGVENPLQAAYLGSLGCSLGQGYLWARPMAERELIAWWQGQAVPRVARMRYHDATPGQGYPDCGSGDYREPGISTPRRAAYIA